jgi:hypothetical protein
MAGWTECAARGLRAVAEALHRQEQELPRAPTMSRILEEDDLLAVAGDHGLSLLDENCHGYIIIRLVEIDGVLRLVNEHVMPRVAWPAIHEYLEHMRSHIVAQLIP